MVCRWAQLGVKLSPEVASCGMLDRLGPKIRTVWEVPVGDSMLLGRGRFPVASAAFGAPAAFVWQAQHFVGAAV